MIRSLRLSPLFGLLTMTAACTGVSLGTGSTSSGCGPGGANTNQHSVGDQPGGVQLQAGDIAVAPSGDYVIFQGKDSLAVGFPDTGKEFVLSGDRAMDLDISLAPLGSGATTIGTATPPSTTTRGPNRSETWPQTN